jgi:uncharacterized SAM-binding protein YcdF (DUF218 family)
MEFGFFLKKLISMWLMPLPFACLIILSGLVLSFWKVMLGRLTAFVGVIALMLFSWHPVANNLLYPIESQYARFDTSQSVDVIVVLGNCHTVNSDIPPMAQLCGTGLHRLMEGYRIWLANPSAELFLSGYAGNESRSYAEVSGEIAQSLGVPQDRIRLFPTAMDTQQEAELSAPFLQGKRFALVTAASHMQRSMEWFERQKPNGVALQPIAAPAYFAAQASTNSLKIDTTALQKTERYWYETLGRLWSKIKS